jgi:sterol desaturase/sphingolipid hydroxylase (fatty acid hydroxylase superfamily)
MDMWVPVVLAAAVGRAAWPLVEYAAHGWLAHRGATAIARMHWSHHIDYRRVFTPLLAWLPSALAIFALLCCVIRPLWAAAAVCGLLVGFARYEYLHFRWHFRRPRTHREAQLRLHHLAHHTCNPRAYFGVTSRWTDRVFGSLPAHWRQDYARVLARESAAHDDGAASR